MIPRRFFWLFDFLMFSAAFLGAYAFFPSIHQLMAITILRVETIATPAGWGRQLPPLLDLLWIFLTVSPASLIVLGVMGNHRPLLHQFCTRIIAGACFDLLPV